jgi:hypothetical protein
VSATKERRAFDNLELLEMLGHAQLDANAEQRLRLRLRMAFVI